jgi:hypothetical protein
MKTIITILTALVCLAGFQACGNEKAEFGTEPKTKFESKMSYELPQGWTWHDEEERIAIWNHTARGENAPFVKLEPMGFPEGTEQDAKARIQALYNEWQESCKAQEPEPCDLQPEYAELDIAGTIVYTAMSTDYFWGHPSWNSSLSFYKDGNVVSFSLGDRADLYKKELETIISTLSW